jgi:iron complex outermembrane receptor protein
VEQIMSVSSYSKGTPRPPGSRSLLWSGAIVALALPGAALAQQATPLPPVPVQTVPEPSSFFGGSTLGGDALESERLGVSDTATLLDAIPGAGAAANGGVSSLPVIHGLADDRIKTEVNGIPITSACPNHMNPPLSYIDPSHVGTLNVMAGITPVSAGGDSIGGTITVMSASPVFAAPGEGLHTEGSLSAFYGSNGNNFGAAASVTGAIDNVSLNYTGSGSKSSDYVDGAGKKVASSLYETSNQALTAALRTDNGVFTLQAGGQYIPYQGFPGARMDMTDNHSYFVNGNYQGQFNWGNLDARLYWQHVDHTMDFLSEKFMGMHMPMDTSATDLGYSLKAEVPLTAEDTLRIGNEFHRYTLEDWWPATMTMVSTMGPNTFININNGERNQLGTYLEWEKKWAPQWTTLLGVRSDLVMMDTGDVSGYNDANSATSMMTMAKSTFNYLRDSTAFNAQSHARTDANFDLTGLARYEPDDNATLEAGLARKTRSPNLYERYAWSTGAMASSMVTWFNDGNEYVGNLNLKPEVANTVSVSGDLHDAARTDWDVKLTPYFTYIEDYIGVDQIGFDKGNNVPLLQFANHDAILYGVDLSARKVVWNNSQYGKGTLAGTVGYVRAYTTDGEGLYDVMPLNGRLSVTHELGGWKSGVELELVDDKTEVDNVRREPTTPAYALVNLHTGYQWQTISVDFGIKNLFDKQYYEPLGGVDYADARVSGDTKGPYGPLPGPGRSFVVSTTVKF